MKRKFTLFLILTLLSYCVTYASTIRINSSLSTDKAHQLFANLQEAHDDASVVSGDTLLVEGSIKNYTDLVCTKRLVIIGPGYFLSQNPNTQANPLPAYVQHIAFNKGSEGSSLIGLTFMNNSTNYLPEIKVDNITIMRCYLYHGISLSGKVNNLLILQNYFERSALSLFSTNDSFSGIIFKNNVVRVSLSVSEYDGIPRTFAVVDNNIFTGEVKLTAASFRNNIIVSKTSSVQVNSTSVQNNLTGGDQLSAKPTNQTFISDDLFVGLAGANQSLDAQYHLKATSPYLKAGYNGSEPGIFGGMEPYVLSGIPPIPTIYEIQADAVATKDGGLKVTVKAKVNP